MERDFKRERMGENGERSAGRFYSYEHTHTHEFQRSYSFLKYKFIIHLFIVWCAYAWTIESIGVNLSMWSSDDGARLHRARQTSAASRTTFRRTPFVIFHVLLRLIPTSTHSLAHSSISSVFCSLHVLHFSVRCGPHKRRTFISALFLVWAEVRVWNFFDLSVFLRLSTVAVLFLKCDEWLELMAVCLALPPLGTFCSFFFVLHLYWLSLSLLIAVHHAFIYLGFLFL